MAPHRPAGKVTARATGEGVTAYVTRESDGLFYVWVVDLTAIRWTYAYRQRSSAVQQMASCTARAQH